ncbi:MAG: 3-deoxy-manno-octulosonate cytidylyltransferase [Anaerolineaceae bacterium]|jgi:3-deoxy-manno-octulosonate cytidylyltransferase (CMP-KDO synthetase)|nr:MAG: 3-deoxy-manno-octulosonate cytidylyltransferase [Anaerolineaceae bacterium]
MFVLGIIPARYGSSRLEGKPLKDICGKPMIQHVYERVLQSKLLNEVIVATDDERIVTAVKQFGGKAQMTSIDHKNGTDRIAEVARDIPADIVVNIQGDEPLIDPRMIDEAIQPMMTDMELKACTLCRPILSEEDVTSPHVVKTVFDIQGNALIFSRAPIPYPRNRQLYQAYEHIGVYVYRKDFLMQYIKMSQTPLEITESLEQLRIIENGIRMKVVVVTVPYEGLSVDTQEDLDRVRAMIKERS